MSGAGLGAGGCIREFFLGLQSARLAKEMARTSARQSALNGLLVGDCDGRFAVIMLLLSGCPWQGRGSKAFSNELDFTDFNVVRTVFAAYFSKLAALI